MVENHLDHNGLGADAAAAAFETIDGGNALMR
jgi:hypothetical protein